MRYYLFPVSKVNSRKTPTLGLGWVRKRLWHIKGLEFHQQDLRFRGKRLNWVSLFIRYFFCWFDRGVHQQWPSQWWPANREGQREPENFSSFGNLTALRQDSIAMWGKPNSANVREQMPERRRTLLNRTQASCTKSRSLNQYTETVQYYLRIISGILEKFHCSL